jgi:DegV family protein with EDD domain
LEKIKIITDSTCDLPLHIIEKYDIEVLPLLVNIGDKSYSDGVDITINELLDRIKTDNMFPTTSQVNPQRFMGCYEKYISEGYKIVSLHISSRMSGTCQSARMAKDMLGSQDIIVIDSLNVTAGLGLLVLKACKLREQGFSAEEIEREVIAAIPHVKSALAFESLDNLVRGGRLSKTAGVIGGLLNIKPILAVKEGEMAVIDKVRGSKKAISSILNYIDKLGVKEGEICFLLYVDNEDILDSLRTNLVSKNIEFIEGSVGCVVGAHAGPNACGLFFIENL